MREGVPRFLLALTAIVAIGIICLVIKDHVQEKEDQPPAGTNSATAQSNASTPRKKISAEIKRTRMFATNAGATAQAGGDEMEKPLISDEFGNAGAKAKLANAKRVSAQAGQGEEAAMDQNNEVDSKIARPALPPRRCLPLPNMTNLTDVDAPYYNNWAREYSCYDTIQSAVAKPKLK
jgi:hypothetical protein